MRISVIIPTYNESQIIEKTIRFLQNYPEVEVVIIDGKSHDETVNMVKKLGVKAEISPLKGKANQMNYGVKICQGDTLLFLHADTLLPLDFITEIETILEKKEAVAGAFQLRIDHAYWGLRVIEGMVRIRSTLFSLPYGDQGIFLKKSVFQEIGEYQPIPIMEDFELIQRLKKRGKICLSSQYVLTSARRWEKLGIVKTTLINQLMILGYYCGISLEKLAQFYQKQRNR